MPSKSRKDRLLIITQSFIKHKGDILSKHIFVAAKLLVQTGWEVSVLAPHENRLARHEDIEGVKVFRFKYFWTRYERLAYTGRMHEVVARSPLNLLIFLFFLFFFLLRAVQVAKRTRPLAIHAHWWIPTGIIGCLVSHLTNIPLLVTLHGTDARLIRERPFLSSLARWVFMSADKISVVSHFIKEQLVGGLRVPADKIFVFPMPIDTEKIYKKEVPPPERKMVLCVARLLEQKDLGTLIRAFHRLHQNWRELDLVIIGEGSESEKAKLENLIRKLNLEKDVALYDFMLQEELNQYYNMCDLYVLPSLGEGFGLQLVEAQLCKKPVIGARSGAIPEIIEDGKTGLLVPPQDPGALASAMERILADENLASRLGEGGYQSAKARFSQETFLRKYVKVLRWAQRKF